MESWRRPDAGALAACAAGPSATGPHVDGLRHGPWRIVHPGGSVEEGRHVAGRLHGPRVLRDAGGAVVARERWRHGRAANPGEAGCERAARADG